MKKILLVIFSFFSLPVFACSSGQYYEINANNSIVLAFVFFAFLALSLTIRIIRENKKLYIPIIIALLSSIIPILEILRWGYGDCGYGLYESLLYSISAMLLLTIYELTLLYIWKHKTKENA